MLGNATLLAIGWLTPDCPIPSGPVSREVYDRLKGLLRDPWQPVTFLGLHDCGLCRFNAEARGHFNLFVPAKKAVYVCPDLILHYMNVHGYAPPQEFCEAVLRCPDTRTMEYKRLLLSAGARDASQVTEG
jgi:hypothetical protein